MAIDPTKLTQSELLQMINATPIGVVLTRSRLRRQMDAGALRFGDGTTIHLVRYVRWLAGEMARPKTHAMDYDEAKARQAKRNRAATRASQDISPIPDVKDYERRQSAAESLRVFCETYFQTAFYRGWSNDHLSVLGRVEQAVRHGGLFAFAMPRGSGKTTIARCSALWAILYGYCPFVCMIGATDDRAKELLIPIKKLILENPLLVDDFPEAVYPLRALENSSKRQLQQHVDGRLTHVHWGQDKLVFPTLDGDHVPLVLRQAGWESSPSSGSIITTTSLDANMRGQQHTRADGSIIRPSLVLLDDPQTRQSAASVTQTRRRMELLNGDMLGMAGPGETIASVLTGTKIYDDDFMDQVLDREQCPEWDSECTKLVYSFPSNTAMWDRYEKIRADSGHVKATEFYRDNREAMDAGAVVAWDDRYDIKTELSAIQHAINLRLKVGTEAFASEYQNEPVYSQSDEDKLTVEDILSRHNGRKRLTVPSDVTKITTMVDVHDNLLYYATVGWAQGFAGYILDYGTYPDQGRSGFTLRDAPKPMSSVHNLADKDAVIHAGLEALLRAAIAAHYIRDDGVQMQNARILVDKGYKPKIIEAVLRRINSSVIMMSRGSAVTARKKPFSEYARKVGQQIGDAWMIPSLKGSQKGTLRYVAIDVNHWKTFIHNRFRVGLGGAGGLTLFGTAATNHRSIAEHVATSENWRTIKDEASGRVVAEWMLSPSKPDNHWFDCLVGCAVGASMEGIALAGDASLSVGVNRRRVVTLPKRRRSHHG